MKAILEFNLPEERDEFAVAEAGWRYKDALEEFDNYLRGQLKYCELDEARAAIYQELRDRLRDSMRELPL